MNWDAIGAIAEVVGTIAILITLLYLAVQMRLANQQRELESFRQNWDGLNQCCEMLSESQEKASIVNRGRESLSNLNDDERMVFEYIHIRMLNTIEAWYVQLNKTSPPGAYRDQQTDNISGLISYWFDYPGARDIWNTAKHTFVPVQQLVDNSLSGAEIVSH